MTGREKKHSCRYEELAGVLYPVLLKRMETQTFHKITVQSLCRDAGIARQTFYLHFSNRDALFCAYVDNIFEVFYQDIAGPVQQNLMPGADISTHLFAQWEEHQALARLIFANGLESLLIGRFRGYIARVMGLYIRHHGIRVIDSERQAYMTDYLAGAFWMVLQRWVRTGFRYSAAQLAELFTQLTEPGFTQAMFPRDG